MKLELKVNGRQATVKKISQEGSLLTVSVDDKIYTVDVYKVSSFEYSIISGGLSHNVEVIEGWEKNHFNVNTFYNEFDIGVVDERMKYLHGQGDMELRENTIVSPMPGKVVKVLVKPGDQVEADQTVIILSAMKMENEFKAGRSGVIGKVAVKEGDTVDTHQLLVSFKKDQ